MVIDDDGVEAEVRCTGASLEIVFPRSGAPGELIEAFAAVRGAFAISKVLGGLIGGLVRIDSEARKPWKIHGLRASEFKKKSGAGEGAARENENG